jgi:hypothetical protein
MIRRVLEIVLIYSVRTSKWEGLYHVLFVKSHVSPYCSQAENADCRSTVESK